MKACRSGSFDAGCKSTQNIADNNAGLPRVRQVASDYNDSCQSAWTLIMNATHTSSKYWRVPPVF
jgi:hypothetical protein